MCNSSLNPSGWTQDLPHSRFLFLEEMGGWIGIRDTIWSASLILFNQKPLSPSRIFFKYNTVLFDFEFFQPNLKEMILNVKNRYL